MKSKVAAATLCAMGLAMSMSAANAARFGDENDLSWLYRPASKEDSSTASRGAPAKDL